MIASAPTVVFSSNDNEYGERKGFGGCEVGGGSGDVEQHPVF